MDPQLSLVWITLGIKRQLDVSVTGRQAVGVVVAAKDRTIQLFFEQFVFHLADDPIGDFPLAAALQTAPPQ
jgi:hypothetical protein